MSSPQDKDTSSSSGVVFARPAKEWTIPSRPKPGRKSKQPPTTIASNDVVRVSNRDAQRAFRERKTEYVASLEARIAAFEKGENQRNVALQTLARKVKEENDRFRDEIKQLRATLSERDAKILELEQRLLEQGRSNTSLPDISQLVSQSTSSSSYTTVSPAALQPDEEQKPITRVNASTQGATAVAAAVADLEASCGFCTGMREICVCRMVEDDALELPPPEPAVRLRKRSKIANLLNDQQQTFGIERVVGGVVGAGVNTRPITQITSETQLYIPPAECSGDPRNCPACKDDAFGKAFCESLGASVCAGPNRCSTCPSGATYVALSCCGDKELCGAMPNACEGSSEGPSRKTTIGADEAWRQLKAHPQASMDNLQMLAEVVARGTACASPPPQTSPPSKQLPPDKAQRRRWEIDPASVKEALTLLEATNATKKRKLDILGTSTT